MKVSLQYFTHSYRSKNHVKKIKITKRRKEGDLSRTHMDLGTQMHLIRK